MGFPGGHGDYNAFGSSSANQYGTDANFQANYRLTPSFVSAQDAVPEQNRIWIGGYKTFETDVSDYDALLTSRGSCTRPRRRTAMAHRWDSGWIPIVGERA